MNDTLRRTLEPVGAYDTMRYCRRFDFHFSIIRFLCLPRVSTYRLEKQYEHYLRTRRRNTC